MCFIMVAVETRELAKDDELEKDSELKNDGATSLKLTSSENEQEVNLPGQIEVNIPQQIEVNIPRQIKMNVPGPSTRNLLRINDRPNRNSDSNRSNVKKEETEQMKMLQFIFNLFEFYGLFLGYKLNYHSKPHQHAMFYVTNFFVCLTCVCFGYTLYFYYINGNMVKVLEPLAVSGLFSSCNLKWYGALKHRKQIIALLFSIKKFCRANIYNRQAEIIKSSIRRTKTYMLILVVAAFVCGSIFALTPFYVYVTSQEIIPLVPLEIIFCDQSQTKGFIIASITHIIMGSYSALAIVYYASAFIFAIDNYTFQVTLIGEDFITLDEMWNGKNDIKLKHKRSFLKNICKKREDINNYMNELKSIFESKLFWYFCSSYFAQIVCLYDIKRQDWIGGFGPALGIFVELMFYCYMGTKVTTVDEKLCHVIYNCNWYKYDLTSQRVICMLLNEAQQNKELQLGPIGRLNLMTGLMIAKSIFTYYRILSEVF